MKFVLENKGVNVKIVFSFQTKKNKVKLFKTKI